MKSLKPLLRCLPIVMLPSLLLAQPAEWAPTATNAAGTLLGTVTVAGEPAMAGDWVAAFDETGVCAGATEVVLNDGESFVSLPIYGDDATTPDTDEGMGGGEGFTLRLWRSANGEILFYPDAMEPAALGGWSATNGAPMPGFDDPYEVYNFAWDGPSVELDCPPAEMCISGMAFNLSATPDNGSWSGPGTIAGFAGWMFVPGDAGLGTHILTYTTTDGLSASCSVTVTESLTPTLDLPIGWCQGDGPLFIEPFASPPGGSWTGDGVLALADDVILDPIFLSPGSYAVTYTIEGDCGGTATDNLSIYPSPEPPTITPQQGLLYAGGIAEGDSIQWWTEVTEVPGDSAFAMGYFDPILYFPVWNDVYLVEAINSYGCSTFSAPFLVDMTIGMADLGEAPFRLWISEGQLMANTPLVEATWFDLTGRQLAHSASPFRRPAGLGPLVVWAQDKLGRTHRMRLP